MTLINIIIISIIQGLTEFLPVSSSGHLIFIPKLLNLPDQGITMDLALHLGTLLAVFVYYRKDIGQMILAFLFWKDKERVIHRKLGLYIILATIPAVILGLLMHILLPEGLRDIRIIITTTILFGILMGFADKYSPQEKDLSKITAKSALKIGLAQVLAFIPGTSRSGITMTMARFLGFNREDSARFSFLLSIPAIAGAGCFAILDFLESGDAQMGIDMLTAIILSFIVGLFAIYIMIKWIKKYGLMPFVIYRLVLGFGLIAWVLLRA